MKYDAVIFDLFGTLVDNVAYLKDTSADYYQTRSNVAAALSIPLEFFLPLWSATEDERYTGFFPSMEAYLKWRQPEDLSHSIRSFTSSHLNSGGINGPAALWAPECN